MKRLISPAVACCIGAAAIGATLAGCGGDTKLPAQQQAAFKGGPMPASAQQIIAQHMRESAGKIGQKPAGH